MLSARAQASVKSPPKLEDEGRGNRERERENAMLLAGVFDKVQAMSPPAPARVDRVGDAAIYHNVLFGSQFM